MYTFYDKSFNLVTGTMPFLKIPFPNFLALYQPGAQFSRTNHIDGIPKITA
jgi:hypothetical protein